MNPHNKFIFFKSCNIFEKVSEKALKINAIDATMSIKFSILHCCKSFYKNYIKHIRTSSFLPIKLDHSRFPDSFYS